MWLALLPSTALAADIEFTNFAEDPSSGISWVRTPSDGMAAWDQLRADSLITPVPQSAFFFHPHRPEGLPGVAMIDADGDGDDDIYVTNGPGTPNSLFMNQLMETGSLSFIDTGATNGAGADAFDSQGVCFGDLDNDGDDDLYVTSRDAGNQLFSNNGDGTFTHVMSHGAEGGTMSHMGCTMGDINNDGLLDIFVNNVFPESDNFGFITQFAVLQKNQLFVNQGSLTFADEGASRGIEDIGAFLDPSGGATPGTISWASAMVDIDGDGDIDIMHADDQALPVGLMGSVLRGKIHILKNDGTGHFTDSVVEGTNLNGTGDWMGFSFGDLDSDGNLDFFASNSGDYTASVFFQIPLNLGARRSRWFFSNGDGTFTDSEAEGRSTGFGWGNAIVDLDNDGDQDIAYHGSMGHAFYSVQDNPGSVWQNDGTGTMTQVLDSFREEYGNKGAHGAAIADLDQDGRVDMVVASNHTVPDGSFTPVPGYGDQDMDAYAQVVFEFIPVSADPMTGEPLFAFNQLPFTEGELTVELNSTEGAGLSTAIRAKGSVGLTSGATNNRSGIGAMITFTPYSGNSVMSPVMGGSSYLSQHSLTRTFGLGSDYWGTADVQWVGGAKNRLYFVWAGENLVMPEIPCSYDTNDSLWTYAGCVGGATSDLRSAGVLSWSESWRFYLSAIWAYFAG